MQIFYQKEITTPLTDLQEEEARHLVQVLRKKPGDQVRLVDGQGGFYLAEVAQTGKKSCTLRILSAEQAYKKRPFSIHLVVAPTKNIARTEWLLEKATEIGVDTITPMLCFHSERRNLRADRLEKVLISAMKQSVKAYLPELRPLRKMNELLPELAEDPAAKFIAWINPGVTEPLQNTCPKGKDVILLIGPEGGFSAEEAELAQQHGFKAVSLGESRLRTETAGLAAVHIVNLINAK